MTETVSNQKTFSFPVDEIIDEAIEMVGKEFTSGLEASNARRSLNLLLLSLQNQQIPMNTVKEVIVDLVSGQLEYDLPVEVSDVIGESGYLFRDGLDTSLKRIGVKEYQMIPDKDKSQRPTSFVVDRQHDLTKIKTWPVTDVDTDQIKLLCSTYIDTVTASYEILQIPRRFYPAITAGLAYTISKKREGVPENKRMRLQMDYERELDLALFEDGERVDMIVRHPYRSR